MATGGVGTLPDYYRMGEVYYINPSNCNIEIELIQQNKIHNILNSKLTNPTVDRPVYVRNPGTTKIERERKIQAGVSKELEGDMERLGLKVVN